MRTAYGLHQAAADVIVADNDDLAQKLETHTFRDAAKADEVEHLMTLGEAWRIHKKAILWSMSLSRALIMEGYDVVVIGSFYGQPNFLKRFGTYVGKEVAPNSPNGYIIPAEWQVS